MNRSIKNNKNIWLVGSFVFLAFFVFSPRGASAATINLFSDKDTLSIGDEFNVDLKIDSEGVGVNAAQTTLQFSKDLVTVTKVDKTNSVFNFWLAGPSFDNTAGTVNFIGGSSSGLSGKSLQVLRVTFKVNGSGTISLTLNDAAVTASDGSGTNVLTAAKGIQLSSLTKSTISVIVPTTTNPTPQISPNAPVKPVILVQLYPDPASWYNTSADFKAEWNLPKDITDVATALNKVPVYNPQVSEGLFSNKNFKALDNGISYLHVRFKNNMGWGVTSHYRIAVDTVPPASFKLSVLEGEKTDVPAPTLVFQTSDGLSGLKGYQILTDDGNLIDIPAKNFNGKFLLPLQPPGKHSIVVRATDQAGNRVEDNLNLEIIPISSPVITFTPSQVFIEDELGLAAKGTALPGVNVLLKVQRVLSKGGGEIVQSGTVNSDENGNWDFQFVKQPLQVGKYVLLAQAQDKRGALSLIVTSQEIDVKSKPVVQIGSFQLGFGGMVLILSILLILSFGSGIWFYKKRQEKLKFRVVVEKSEIGKIFLLIKEGLGRLTIAQKKTNPTDYEYELKRLQDLIQKMEEYLEKGIEKIEK